MAEEISSRTAWAFAKAVRSLMPEQRDQKSEAVATVTNVDQNGQRWVSLFGSENKTPVNGVSLSEVSVGDVVRVKIEGGALSIVGNATDPAAGTAIVDQKVEPAMALAGNAYSLAETAKEAADAAVADAQRAHEAADAAEADAAEAAISASQAATSASTAATQASNAATSASTAATQASNAATSASNAAASADEAATSASTAATQASNAATSASNAARDAATAASQATRATTAANDALDQVAIVQDVAGTLEWMSTYGSYELTTDTSVQPHTVYFELESGDYVPIVNPDPTANPSQEGWYVLSESQSDYIMAHLAVTSRGLWVLPSGIGAGTTPASGESQSDSDARQALGYKLLLANNGIHLYDPQGHIVTTYGESITFDSSRPQSIGGEDAYILYYDTDDDGVPDSILISGGNVTIDAPVNIGGTGKTLSEVTETAIGTIIYDHSYTFDENHENAVFTAYLYRGGVDVKTEYLPSQFVWYYKTEDDDSLHSLGTGYQCTVALSLMGYGGHVIGKFVDTQDANLLTRNDDQLTDELDRSLTVRVQSGQSVRVSDLSVATMLDSTDKIVISSNEGEQLVSIETLQGYLESHMSKQVLFGTSAQWAAQPSLQSETETIYIYTDYGVDQYGNALAGIKVGDGNAYVVDLPFTDAALTEHLADNVRHITAAERAFWNSKVRCYYGGQEQLVFTTS